MASPIEHQRKDRLSLQMFLLCTLFLSACSSANTTIRKKPLGAQTQSAPSSELRTYLGYLNRLDRVASRIFQTGTPLCQHIGRDPGIITYRQNQFPRKLRKQAQAELSTSTIPSIILVRNGGPAVALRQGDILLGSNDQPIDANNKDIQTYLAAGFLRIQRDGQEEFIAVSAPRACAYRVHLKMDSKISAKASGGQITVSSGLLEFAKTDSELAFVLGHELAHGIKKHMKQAVFSGGLLGLANQKMQGLETEADYVGLTLATAAGYDMIGAEVFWQRMIDADTQNQAKGRKHPTRKQRLVAIRTFAAHIKEKQNEGQSLTQMQKPPH